VISRYTKRLSFRIIFPVVIIISLSYTALYVFVLKNISLFATKTIETAMDEMKHDIYEICDDGLNRLIRRGYQEDQRHVLITKAEVLRRIENFMLNNDILGFIEEKGAPKNFVISGNNSNSKLIPLQTGTSVNFTTEELEGLINSVIKESPSGGLFTLQIRGISYYGTSIRFEPWGWRIFLFKEQGAFSDLLKSVRLTYAITGIVFYSAIILLICLLHYFINKPINDIVASLRSGKKPEYRGTEEIEYLSSAISDSMEELRREARLLDNIYHVAILKRGEDFFDEVVITINRLFGLNSLVARVSPDGEYAETVSLFINGELRKGIKIPLKGTPCEDVIHKKHMCVIEKDAWRHYPDAFLLTSTKAESFIGLAIFTRKGEIAGIMNAFGKEKVFSEVDVKAFQTIGQLVGIEFERIDEEKEKELIREQLFQAQKLEAIGTLAGGIAHDFNNMLQAILGYASLLKINTPKDHPSYNALDVIEKTSMRAAELTKQLLGFARKGKYVVELLNLNDIVHDVYKVISETFERTIEIRLNLWREGLIIEGDKSQLTSVLLNICINARDAMPQGGLLTIETFEKKMKPDELIHPGAKPIRYACVSVTDTGIGMDEETMKHIFEPFFTTKEVGKGTGMGLAMAYGVVENHGGFITVTSSPGKGSCFVIHLPIAEGKPEGGKKETGESLSFEKSKGRILVVEDDRAIRTFTKKSLEDIGYEVLEAVDGLEALEIFEREKDNLDLILLDLILPKLNGLEVFKRVKEIKPAQRIVISTGYGLKEHIAQIIDMDDTTVFLEKPYTYLSLKSAIREVLH